MAKIHLLPDNLAHKIAAGEVIERPASVVKELVENSIDAHATTIEIEIREGGKEYIRVSDNGIGISSEDVPIAFMRHATSKISSVDDLFNINTLGFRGEALPSIASISRLTLKTRQHADQKGHQIEFDQDTKPTLSPVGTAPGTSVEVRDIFYNTPARYKFLKTTTTEKRYIVEFVSSICIAHPTIAFRLVADDQLILRSSGKGDLLEVISAIYDFKTAKAMLPVSLKTHWGQIAGFVGPPNLARGNRQAQLFVLNGRVIRSPMLASAVGKAYQGMLAQRQFPIALLVITMDPDRVDVNVHPTKAEVRFQEEQELFQAVLEACKNGLLTKDLSVTLPPSNSLGSESVKHEHTQERLDLTRHFPWQPESWDKVDAILNDNTKDASDPRPTEDLQPTAEALVNRVIPQLSEEVETRYQVAESREEITETNTVSSNRIRDALLNGRIIGQLHQSFILIEVDSGLWILDQHIIHERILYERLQSQEYRPHIQQLLPQPLDFSPRDSALVLQHLDKLAALGIELEVFGTNTYLLRGVPQFLATQARLEQTDILALISDLEDGTHWREKVILTLACQGAIKARKKLNEREIHSLLEQLVKTENPFTCPHGRPIIVKIEEAELLKRFGR